MWYSTLWTCRLWRGIWRLLWQTGNRRRYDNVNSSWIFLLAGRSVTRHVCIKVFWIPVQNSLFHPVKITRWWAQRVQKRFWKSGLELLLGFSNNKLHDNSPKTQLSVIPKEGKTRLASISSWKTLFRCPQCPHNFSDENDFYAESGVTCRYLHSLDIWWFSIQWKCSENSRPPTIVLNK